MPKIVGGVRVVDTGKLSIDEVAGNVASSDDRISIAQVHVSEPTCEPWLTLQYDEWMVVTRGRVLLHFNEGKVLEVAAGQTVMIEKGERFQPVFPDGDTEYIPVCLPAFRPDRCIREDEPDSDISKKLALLHNGNGTQGSQLSNGKAGLKRKAANAENAPPAEVLYHVCLKKLWDEAKAAGTAYFPPTFESDGFTHATAVPGRLVETANHFYQDVPGEWVCLRFRRSVLRRNGIFTKDEEAMPVGNKSVSNAWENWVCPHVMGGIPAHVVDAEFPMLRDGGVRYVGIPGLTDVPRRIFKLATEVEASRFQQMDKIQSELDKNDGFIHLSDRNSAPVVARLFFKECSNLRLLEIDADRLPGSIHWIVGEMGSSEPDQDAKGLASTVVHYLKPDGCVHIYGEAGVPLSAVVREEAVPLGEDGAHVFPTWL